MATVLEGGGDLFDSLAYGRPQPGVYDFLAHKAQQYSQNLTQTGVQFVQNVKSYFAAVTESEAAMLARAAGRKVRSLWDTDDIRGLLDINEFQHAGLKMQRWVMAEPTTRQLYINQGCEGYADSYVDVEPGRVGESHYDWRRVMDGIVVETDKGWSATTYLEEIRPNDVPLLLDEQADILYAWENLRTHIHRRKSDPTSRYNGSLA